jgi:tetratricopeptide (TPR) repeat protein
MVDRILEKVHEARAMEFANLGIGSQAAGNHQAARQAWLDALDYSERHLPDHDIILWIRSGLGETLLRNGDYPGALEMAGSALEFCAAVRAPLAALTMTEAHLRLGDVTRAREYARQACYLRGEKVLDSLSPDDRRTLSLAISR